MIGYSPFAQKYYHKVGPYMPEWGGWASACRIRSYIAYRYPPEEEYRLQHAAPKLTRCLHCWT